MQSASYGLTSRRHEVTILARTIERTLESISVTPRIHREDLLRHFYRPVCWLLEFDASDNWDDQVVSSRLSELEALRDRLILTYAMQQASLQNNSSFVNGTKCSTAKELQATQIAVSAFCRKAEVIYENLGSWAADYFVNQTIRVLEKSKD